MYAPIYLPQAGPVPADVLDAERAILAAEGPCHVEGRYFPREADANCQRRWSAERRVREAAAARVPAPRVSTWLSPRERSQVDAAAGLCLTTLHRDALPAISDDLAQGRADAALLSAALVRATDAPALARLARGFPACAVAGLVTDAASPAAALAAAHTFGRAGVATLLDCRASSNGGSTAEGRGWVALRGAFEPRHLPDAFQRACVAAVLADLRGEPATAATSDATDAPDSSASLEASAEPPLGLARFFALAFAPDVSTSKQLAARLGVPSSTLVSRFWRAGLPSPRRYVALARLAWAAHLGESPALSVAAIANRVEASSPQSFGRTVRNSMGVSAAEFRRTTTGAAMLAHYRVTLVAPHRDALRTFDPLAGIEDGRRRRRTTNRDATRADRQPRRTTGRAA